MIKLIRKLLVYFKRERIIRKQKKQLDHYLRENYQITLDGIPLSMTDKKKEKGSLSWTW